MTTEPRSWPGDAALVALIGLGAVALDIATKYWAVSHLAEEPVSLLGGWVVFTESRNPGAAFGLGTQLTPVLTVVAAVAAVAILVLARRARSLMDVVALGLALGGAVGNLVDRLFRPPRLGYGHVVDWVDVGAWPTFNLADACLVLAVGLFLLPSLRRSDRADADQHNS